MARPGSRSVSANQQGTAVAGREGDRIVVWLRGEHDIASTADLSETLVRACAVDDSDLVVDLSEVQFMDASTMGVLVRARDVLRSRSRSLSVRDPARCARRVLDACGLAELIDSGPPRSEAAGALGSWVAVPAIDRADHPVDGSAPAGATTARPGQREQVGEHATVSSARRTP